MRKKNSPLNPVKGILGVRFYVLMLRVYVSKTRFPNYRAIEDVYLERYTYFYIMYLCHSPIYFTLPRGGSSPPLVQLEEMILTSQYLYIISKCSSFQALFKLFSSCFQALYLTS